MADENFMKLLKAKSHEKKCLKEDMLKDQLSPEQLHRKKKQQQNYVLWTKMMNITSDMPLWWRLTTCLLYKQESVNLRNWFYSALLRSHVWLCLVSGSSKKDTDLNRLSPGKGYHSAWRLGICFMMRVKENFPLPIPTSIILKRIPLLQDHSLCKSTLSHQSEIRSPISFIVSFKRDTIPPGEFFFHRSYALCGWPCLICRKWSMSQYTKLNKLHATGGTATHILSLNFLILGRENTYSFPFWTDYCLSCPVLSCPVLSCHVLSSPILIS